MFIYFYSLESLVELSHLKEHWQQHLVSEGQQKPLGPDLCILKDSWATGPIWDSDPLAYSIYIVSICLDKQWQINTMPIYIYHLYIYIWLMLKVLASSSSFVDTCCL